jgi:hypothetical protein
VAERHSGFVNQVAGVGQVTVEDHRLTQSALWTPSGNITSRSGMVPNAASASAPGTVKATSPTPNGLVHVDPFRYVLQSVRGGGTYTLCLDAIKNIDILGDQAANPSNPRNDLIVAQQSDTYFSDASSDMVVRHVIGTPAASPVDPPITGSTDYVVLARVVVRAGTTSILTSDITNFAIPWTVATGGQLPVRNQTDRDSLTPWEGMRCYRADKGWEEAYIGGAWRLLGVPLVSTLSDVTNPYTQQIVRLTSDGRLYEYNGTAWVKLQRQSKWARRSGNGAQSLNIAAGTLLAFPSLVSNDAGITPSGTGNTAFSVPAGGWDIELCARFANTVTADGYIMTGTTYDEANSVHECATGGTGVVLSTSFTLELASTTSICFGLFQGAASKTAIAHGTDATHVAFTRRA